MCSFYVPKAKKYINGHYYKIDLVYSESAKRKNNTTILLTLHTWSFSAHEAHADSEPFPTIAAASSRSLRKLAWGQISN